mgnify:CR=1 FL=1
MITVLTSKDSRGAMRLMDRGQPFERCDVCYTNHAEADQDDMDTLMTLMFTTPISCSCNNRRRISGTKTMAKCLSMVLLTYEPFCQGSA